jgi:hypothetical protein
LTASHLGQVKLWLCTLNSEWDITLVQTLNESDHRPCHLIEYLDQGFIYSKGTLLHYWTNDTLYSLQLASEMTPSGFCPITDSTFRVYCMDGKAFTILAKDGLELLEENTNPVTAQLLAMVKNEEEPVSRQVVRIYGAAASTFGLYHYVLFT